MKYCSDCGDSVDHRVPEHDDRPRYVCRSCGIIHYQNPRVIVGTLPLVEDRVLLCKRAIEPRKGFWTLPAGFMENGESTEQGAMRETWEEARAKIASAELYCLYDITHINQVYFFYRGEVVEGEFGEGPETLESKLFTEQEIPWSELAFPVVTATLERYFSDRKNRHFPIFQQTVERLIPKT